MNLSVLKLRQLALLVVFSLTTTLALQKWVGGATIYSPDVEAKRLLLHRAILTNTVPPGVREWKQLGANGTNLRIGTVYIADALARFTHQPVLKIYRLIDTACLALFFPLLFCFLRRWVCDEDALIGLLYTASILPLTYFLYFFHPWDRPSLVAWILILHLLVTRRFWPFIAVLAISLIIKFDTILIPGLFFLIYFRRERPWPTIAATVALFAMTFGIFAALVLLLPGGGSNNPLAFVIQKNLTDIRELNVAFPPLLVFLLPTILAIVGFREADRAARAFVIFAIGMTLVFFLQTNYQEVRAEMSVLLLLLPAALVGLRRVMSMSTDARSVHASAETPAFEPVLRAAGEE